MAADRTMSFAEALDARVAAEVLDACTACTACGACVEVCPMPGPAGLDAGSSEAIADGVLDLLRGGEGTEASETWAQVCTGSGYCISVCEHGVNPRFMLAMARIALRRRAGEAEVRAGARRSFATMSRGVRLLARLQLPPDLLARVNPSSAKAEARHGEGPPEVVFYTGCNVLRTPHIALLCLDVLDALGVSYEVMGGPSHCCGIFQFRDGDAETAGQVGYATIERLAAAEAPEVLAWCPSCQVQFGETTLPSYRMTHGAAPFTLTPFFVWLERRLDELRPLMVNRVEKRVAVVERPALPEARAAVRRLVEAIPGVDYVALDVPRVGIMSSYLAVLQDFKDGLRETEFAAAAAAGVTTLATVYHACHREICHHQADQSFEIVNVMELLGESMGLTAPDLFKRLKLMADVDAVIADSRELIERYDLDLEALRDHVHADMVSDIPGRMPARD